MCCGMNQLVFRTFVFQSRIPGVFVLRSSDKIHLPHSFVEEGKASPSLLNVTCGIPSIHYIDTAASAVIWFYIIIIIIMPPSSLEILSTTTVTARGGVLHRVQHASTSTKTNMIFAIFLPSSYLIGAGKGPIPAICTWWMFVQLKAHVEPFSISQQFLYFFFTDWLSGLTCTDQNFCQKAGSQAFRKAEEEGIAL